METLLVKNQEDLEDAFQDWTVAPYHTRYQNTIKKTNFLVRSIQLFTISRNRRASVAAVVGMVAQYAETVSRGIFMSFYGTCRLILFSRQLSGVNIFAFLAASVFFDAGFDKIPSLWFAFGFAASNAM